MRVPINPLVDYAFKKLFGWEKNKNLLLHFLNAVIQPERPLTDLQLLDLHLGREHADAKLCIVDVLATDADGRVVQVDLQLLLHQGVPQRMLFNWATLYRRQLASGQKYHEIRPVYGVWILGQPLVPDGPAHRRFRVRDDDGVDLCPDLELHILELPKFKLEPQALDAKLSWVYFLREAKAWTELPTELNTPEMRQAMANMREIFEQEREWFEYRVREEDARVRAAFEYKYRMQDEALQKQQEDLALTQAKLVEAEGKAAEAEGKAAEAEGKAAEAEGKAAEAEGKAAEAEGKAAEAEGKAAEASAEAEALRAQLIALGISPAR